MNTDESVNAVSKRIIGCAFQVFNTLGTGFLEKVYENALAYELRKNGLEVAQQHGIAVRYEGLTIGQYAADLLVEGCVLVELKCVKALDEMHRAQCLNYLKATGYRLCLLLNFARSRVDVRRFILD